MGRKAAVNGLKHGLLIFLSFLAVFPLYWMVISSFKGSAEIFNYSLLPQSLNLENYAYAFAEMPIGRMLLNSVVISLVEAAAQLLTAVLAAYALTRWDFKGKGILYGVFLLTWLIPFQAVMVPNYVQVSNMGLNGKVAGIILPYLASAFAVISMYQSFQSFPRALFDAARLDGSGELQILKNIVLPVMKATIASLGILLFITSWNDYMWPMLMAKDLNQAPIQIGLKMFVSSDVNLWGSLMAATTVSCLPILALYLVMQRNIVNSFMKWGIK